MTYPRASVRRAIASLGAVGAALALSVASPAQTKPAFDMNQLIGKNHAQIVKLLGQPTKQMAEPGKPPHFAVFRIPKGLVMWIGYRDGVPMMMTAYLEAAPYTPEQVLKLYKLSVGPKPSKTVRGHGIVLVNTARPVPGTKWAKVYLRRSKVQAWDEELKAAMTARNMAKDTLFYTLQLEVARPRTRRGGNISGAGGG